MEDVRQRMEMEGLPAHDVNLGSDDAELLGWQVRSANVSATCVRRSVGCGESA